uniref:Uncharacterized protein n=1 Tax=Rhizophora mucronata TaxID=61149 RepID=A0A2P2P895_RHIMU
MNKKFVTGTYNRQLHMTTGGFLKLQHPRTTRYLVPHWISMKLLNNGSSNRK